MFGIYSNGKRCSESYVDCFNGTQTIQKCPPNLFYDHSIRACTYGDHIKPPCAPEGKYTRYSVELLTDKLINWP